MTNCPKNGIEDVEKRKDMIQVETNPEIDSNTNITEANIPVAEKIAPVMTIQQLSTAIKNQERILESQGKMLQKLLESSNQSETQTQM